MLSLDLPQLLWEGRDEPLYATHPTVNRTLPVSKQEALKRLAQGYRYIAPVPRIALGNKKEHCTKSYDCLFVDIDKEGVPLAAILQEAMAKLDRVSLLPSAVISSGNRGVHMYWKLADDLSIAKVEGYNRHLAQLLGADAKCFDRTRFLRNPGTTHEKTNGLVEVIEMTAEVHDVHALDALGHVQPNERTKQSRTRSPREYRDDSEKWKEAAHALDGWAEPDDLDLSVLLAWQNDYMMSQPDKGWKRGDATRSEVEQAIVYRLTGLGCGASDEQIKTIADKCLAKHIEERPCQGDNYIDRTIAAARRLHYEKGWITSPMGGWPRRRDADHRHATVDRLEVLLDLVRGQPNSEFIAEVIALGYSRSTAYRYRRGFLDEGLVEERDGHIFRLFVCKGSTLNRP